MAQNEITKKLVISNMTCAACEMKIEQRLKKMNGVTKVKARYKNSTVSVTYKENLQNEEKIVKELSSIGYFVGSSPTGKNSNALITFPQLAILLLTMFLLFQVLGRLGLLDFFNYFPQAKEGMGYATLFIVGVLTSVHCIGMCGGITLSQCVGVKSEKPIHRLRPTFLYNSGRVIAYTIIGGIVGALGSVISFNGAMRGVVAIIAGIFMVIMGLNLLNVFPSLRRFNIRLPRALTSGINKSVNGPFYIGLLNGLMPCGPLQAMQLYALSTGDPIKGALSMFFFSIGTTPLMFGFGAVSSMLSKKFTSKMMAVSAVLVIFLGIGMFNTGMGLSGISTFGVPQADTSNVNIVMEDGYQIVEIDISPRGYEPIVVQRGVPVRWNIRATAENLNGCNNAIRIPFLNITKDLQPGDNIIEFTANTPGVFTYTCWMGMIQSSITVIE